MYVCTYTCVAFQWLPENGSAHQQLLFKQEVVLNLISACPCIQLYCLSVLRIYSTYIHTVHHGAINWYCSLGLLSFRHAYRDSKLWHYKEALCGYMCHSITQFVSKLPKGSHRYIFVKDVLL